MKHFDLCVCVCVRVCACACVCVCVERDPIKGIERRKGGGGLMHVIKCFIMFLPFPGLRAELLEGLHYVGEKTETAEREAAAAAVAAEGTLSPLPLPSPPVYMSSCTVYVNTYICMYIDA